jgi:flagellar biosynthetic protein FliQ
MTLEFVNQISRHSMETTVLVMAPVLIVSMVVGLLVSLFQAITQLQEFTLSFVPKILSVFITLFLLLPWMARVMMEFTTEIFGYIAAVGR